MSKIILWKQGIKNMVSKTTEKKRISSVYDEFRATKNDFILLGRRAGMKGWKVAVHSTVDKSYRNVAVESLSSGMIFNMTKRELRRAARLF